MKEISLNPGVFFKCSFARFSHGVRIYGNEFKGRIYRGVLTGVPWGPINCRFLNSFLP